MSNPAFDLQGRVAVVTGASRGLGRAIAVALAQAGAKLCLTARDADGLHGTQSMILENGGDCIIAEQDVRNLESIGPTLDGFVTRYGAVDILVNNAGMESVRPSIDVDEALWDSIVSTNLKGAFFWSRAVGKLMAEKGSGGAIVNQCSLTSFVGVPTAVPYGASKSGVLGMTRALATEWAPYGIRVNALAPGYFRTAMTEPFYQDGDWQQQMLNKIPQRRFGSDSDIAGAAVFLCSDAASYITGHCLPVDGGYLASI
ncbi:glucose 1-dehydrogenase [Hwanghaeella grinnelliae]|uniref:Glucose 1-dehydrogenase n=1 Tax=Hwanghaeella grinnelliae TaxID=2500179 RepID=A0A3S2WUI6_9PROT|nr:glucose 1-dehydrogenase [Hwanghaeella grinnelliae]RVU38831.1 glucose 1-dehydrogenase [Hwanghaeella grinnelliae]